MNTIFSNKVNDDQATTTVDTGAKTTSGFMLRVRLKNTGQTHQETANSAEKVLTGK